MSKEESKVHQTRTHLKLSDSSTPEVSLHEEKKDENLNGNQLGFDSDESPLGDSWRTMNVENEFKDITALNDLPNIFHSDNSNGNFSSEDMKETNRFKEVKEVKTEEILKQAIEE